MTTELMTASQLAQIANPKNLLGNNQDGFKGATNLVTEINKGLGQIMELVKKYDVAKGMINPTPTEDKVNIHSKIEKGINQGKEEYISHTKPSMNTPKLQIHVGKAVEDLKKMINEQIKDEETGKDMKKNFKTIPDDLLNNAVETFIKSCVEIQ